MNKNIYFIGGRLIGGGTDAGGWYIGADGKIHKIPGWNPEGMIELAHALNVIQAARYLKTPGLADHVIKNVMDFTQKELGTHLKEGGVLVLG